MNRASTVPFACAALLGLPWPVQPAALADAPLPDNGQLKQRVMRSMRQSEQALENYSCMVRERGQELNTDNSLKKQTSSLKEQFYVNGIEIEHTLERDGKPLSESDAKKEQDRVNKEVKRYSDPEAAEKAKSKDEKQADLFLRALRLSNGQRLERDHRRTLLYDLSGDPQFHPHKIEERFAQALSGKIWIDEETGTPVEVRFETTRDVKIGGGMLANLHKGFWLHILQQREPDGAWITKDVQGSGDARAALFMHARFRFRETLDKCHLFSVETEEKRGSAPAGEQGPH